MRSASLVFHSSESPWHDCPSVIPGDAVQLLTIGNALHSLVRPN